MHHQYPLGGKGVLVDLLRLQGSIGLRFEMLRYYVYAPVFCIGVPNRTVECFRRRHVGKKGRREKVKVGKSCRPHMTLALYDETKVAKGQRCR